MAHTKIVNLMQAENNNRLYSKLSSALHAIDISAATKYATTPGYRLIRVDNRKITHCEEFEIALINDIESSVTYYCIVTTGDINGEPVAQPVIWLSASAHHFKVARDISRNVFFDYLLEGSDIIISLGLREGESKFFWCRQASDAIAYGHEVTYCNPITLETKLLKTQAELEELISRHWSLTSEQLQHVVIRISKGRDRK